MFWLTVALSAARGAKALGFEAMIMLFILPLVLAFSPAAGRAAAAVASPLVGSLIFLQTP